MSTDLVTVHPSNCRMFFVFWFFFFDYCGFGMLSKRKVPCNKNVYEHERFDIFLKPVQWIGFTAWHFQGMCEQVASLLINILKHVVFTQKVPMAQCASCRNGM